MTHRSGTPMTAKGAEDRLFAAAGARSIYLDGEAQRLLRDVHAAGQHMALWDFGVLSAAYLAASLWLVQAAWPWL